MKKSFCRILLISATVLLVCLLSGAIPAAAKGLPDLACQVGEVSGGNTAVRPQSIGGKDYLFLPAAADLRQLSFSFDEETAVVRSGHGSITVRSGEPFDLTPLFPDGSPDGRYPLTLRLGGRNVSLTVMHSEKISALFLTSQSADSSRAWVEQNKENKAKNGGIVLLGADGAVTYDGTMKNIKGRGNSTWNYPKKPYQIKLNEKADLLETGIPAEAAETWILLANYCDETMLHNSVSFDMAVRLGLPYIPHYAPVDLYYDGEYRGTYLLCEKTEVGPGRVAVNDLDKAYEESNPTVSDFDELPTAYGVNAYGGEFQYVSGLDSPEDLSGGYLLEIDYRDRVQEEKSWFSTTRGSYITCKSPEYANKEGMEYISELYQRFENAVFNGGVDPDTGISYDKLVDVDSLARVYLLSELSMDGDAFLSSCYFYKRAGEDKLYAGPVWDFDSAYGSDAQGLPAEDFIAAKVPLIWKLLHIPSFRRAVSDIWEKELFGIVGDMTDSAGGKLPTLYDYAEELSASQRMNAALWPEASPRSYAGAAEKLCALLNLRTRWLDGVMRNSDKVFQYEFLDVTDDQWFCNAVSYVTNRGIFSGVSLFSFLPQEKMTRAMAITVLYRMAGEPAPGDAASAFADVPDEAWYSGAVRWAAANGIADGRGGRFAPEAYVTRQDFVTFLYRYAGSPAAGNSADDFSDFRSVSPHARNAVGWAVGAGLMKGDHTGRLRPAANITRAEAATLIQQYLER